MSTGIAAIMATTTAASAQTWRWVAHLSVGGRSVAATTELTLSAANVATSMRIPVHNGRDVVSTCTVAVDGIDRTIVVSGRGLTSLQIALKPRRSADCSLLGAEQEIILPADDRSVVDQIALAVNNACCSIAGKPASTVTQAPRSIVARAPASGTPAPPRADMKTKPIKMDDWVRTDGVFSFIRVRNGNARTVLVTNAYIGDCTGLSAGCGASDSRYAIAPGAIATIVTVLGDGDPEFFSYRYVATLDGVNFTGSGTSKKAPPADARSMTDQEIRFAEERIMEEVEATPTPYPTATPRPKPSPPAPAPSG